MHGSYTNRKALKVAMHDKYTVSYSIISVCLHNLQPSYSKHSCSSYFSQVSLLLVFAQTARAVLEGSLHSERVIYCPYTAHSCIKLQSKKKNYNPKRHTEYIQQIIYFIIYLVYTPIVFPIEQHD